MQPKELYAAGQLNEAIAALISQVRQNPGDPGLRMFLSELLCFAGDLERADKHLDAISTQDPALGVEVALFRHLLRAERCRRECFEQGRVPEFVGTLEGDLETRLRSLAQMRSGEAAEAAAALSLADQSRPRLSGSANAQPFSDFRDLDDLFASFLEVLTANGKYYWIPLGIVQRLDFRKPQRPRDLLWRSVHMVAQGMDTEVYLPALYPGSHAEPEDRTRLGRFTDWRSLSEGLVRGVGLRTVLVGDEARTILELENVVFDPTGA